MRALDTSVLVDLLTGRSGAGERLSELEEEELCTTEVNLFELATVARRGKGKARGGRLAALDRLRRKITVLPIDERATRAAAALASTSPSAFPASTFLMMGAIEVNGCSELIARKGAALPMPSKVRLRVLAERQTKTR